MNAFGEKNTQRMPMNSGMNRPYTRPRSCVAGSQLTTTESGVWSYPVSKSVS